MTESASLTAAGTESATQANLYVPS